jgi:hypothetical protein
MHEQCPGSKVRHITSANGEQNDLALLHLNAQHIKMEIVASRART